MRVFLYRRDHRMTRAENPLAVGEGPFVQRDGASQIARGRVHARVGRERELSTGRR